MKVVFARRALRHIKDISEYIAERRPQSADAFLDSLTEIERRLSEHPFSSPLSRSPDVRQATMSRFPYVVTYRVSMGRVMVLGVFHAARHPSVRSRP